MLKRPRGGYRRGFARAAAVVGVAAIMMLFAARAGAQSIPLTPTAQASGAAITYEHGIEFVTVGAVGNQPYGGPLPTFPPFGGDPATLGRGRVDYEYRIGRMEVTSGQWAEFFAVANSFPIGQRIPHVQPPFVWGGSNPALALRAAGGISWRTAAIYCNWLHNNKGTDRASFMSGAYDVSSFGSDAFGFTDQPTHSPEARFWIPTMDEWMKAAHYDPNKNGPGQGGWWEWACTTDSPLAWGPPGGTLNGMPSSYNAGWQQPEFPGNPFHIPLGAYPTIQSPWGLLDTAGATTEWTEEVLGNRQGRLFDGSNWNDSSSVVLQDHIAVFGGDIPPLSTYDLGFRIAARSVPSPSCVPVAFMVLSAVLARRRRSEPCDCSA